MSANDDQPEAEKRTDAGENETNPRHYARAFMCWAFVSLRDNIPHYLIALFTLLLVIFAWYAWDESTKGTAALQEQVIAIKADQRPLMWVTGLEKPTYFDDTGQVAWGWQYQNIGKSIAYKVTTNQYIKIGNERFQGSRNRGTSAIELLASKPVDVPPLLQGGFSTTLSRPGVNKDYFTQLMATDFGIAVLIEFSYSDASGKTSYTNAVCIQHLATGAHAVVPPADCPKQR